MSVRDINKNYCMIITNGLTGENYKISNVQDYSLSTRNAIIEDITAQWTKNNIGYNITYMYVS